MSSKARIFAVSLISVLAFSFSISTARAEASDKPGSPFKDAVMKMFGYGAKTTEKTVDAVGGGVKKSADIITGQDAEDEGEAANGKDIHANPITKTTEAVGETVHGVLTAPIEAGKETYGTK